MQGVFVLNLTQHHFMSLSYVFFMPVSGLLASTAHLASHQSFSVSFSVSVPPPPRVNVLTVSHSELLLYTVTCLLWCAPLTFYVRIHMLKLFNP